MKTTVTFLSCSLFFILLATPNPICMHGFAAWIGNILSALDCYCQNCPQSLLCHIALVSHVPFPKSPPLTPSPLNKRNK